MDTKRQANVDLLYLAVTSNLNSSADELDKFIKQIKSFSYMYINSAIERIDKFDVNEIELKRGCVKKLETARALADAFIKSAQNFFTYADLDPVQEAIIKEYHRIGNYEGIKSHINKVQAFLEQTHECYEEFVKKFEAAKASCDDVVGNCIAKETVARYREIATRVIGSSAAAVVRAGVVAVGVGASLVAGVLIFGLGPIIGLTGAAVGTGVLVTARAAGATSYLVSCNYEILRSEFETVTKDISDLGSSMDKILQKLKATGKNLDMLMKNHKQGSYEEFNHNHKQFTKAFEMLLKGIRKGRLILQFQQFILTGVHNNTLCTLVDIYLRPISVSYICVLNATCI